MLVKTAIFGEQMIDPNTAISFPQGLPGFNDCTRFKLFHQVGSDPVIYWLQSLDRDDVMFSVADPTVFGIHYDFSLTDDEVSLLGTGEPENMLVLILLYRDEAGGAQSAGIKGSIKSPLVINVKTLKGLQKTLMDIEPSITVKERSSSIEFKAR
ncbi:MAG TPA: flagellar assembly protein FliW [Methylococcaceae bacterium]|jgi:flagellar assembly factor FliW|nr:flagellar assembly protein FliW [Methylococcaceae bacterium]